MKYAYLKTFLYVATTVVATVIVFISGCESGDPSGLSQDIIYEQQDKLITKHQLDAIKIAPTNLTITTDQQQKFTVQGLKDGLAVVDLTNDVTWVSDNPTKASIDNRGLLLGYEDGEVNVVANLASLTDTVKVTLSSALLSRIEIETKNANDDLEVEVCGELALKALGIYEGEESVPRDITAAVSWELNTTDWKKAIISNEIAFKGNLKVSDVFNDDLLVIARLAGITSPSQPILINGYSGGNITVSPAVAEVSKDGTLAYRASTAAGRDISQHVVWSSSDIAIATFSSSEPTRNLIKGVNNGSVQVTAKCGDSATSVGRLLTVIDKAFVSSSFRFDGESGNINTSRIELGLNQSALLNYMVKYSDGKEVNETKDTKWDLFGWGDDVDNIITLDTSNDKYIKITTKDIGSAGTIKAIFEGNEKSLEINITPQ